MKILELLGKKVIVFDGAMGTQLQAAGLANGEYPDSWNVDRGDEVKAIHKRYFLAGCDVVTTNTFGSNRLKSGASGYSVDEIVSAAVKNCKEAIAEVNEERRQEGLEERQLFTALDIGPSGKMLDLMGDYDFDEAYDLFKEQVIAGTNAGADVIIFETFSDIAELKAGLIAAKENSPLPIFCTMTFQDDGRMLMGTDPETAVLALQDMGIDAIGVNCSLGPKELLPVISKILKVAKIPVIAQPNAGLPRNVDGAATYDISVDEFVEYAMDILNEGVAVIGGCCGTTPEYIAKLRENVDEANSIPGTQKYLNEAVACTSQKHVFIDPSQIIIEDGSIDIEEFENDLLDEEYEEVVSTAMDIVDDGSRVVVFNFSFAQEDEGKLLKEAVHTVSMNGNIPIAIFSRSPEHIEDAVRYCRGRPLIITEPLKMETLQAFQEIAKKYGADIVCMIDEVGTIAGIQ